MAPVRRLRRGLPRARRRRDPRGRGAERSRATRPRCARVAGRSQLTDGPYAEAVEGMGGFYLVEAPDLDVLLELLQDPAAPTTSRSLPSIDVAYARRGLTRGRRSTGSSARSGAGWSPCSSRSSAASTSSRTPWAMPSRRRAAPGPRTALPTTPPAWLMTAARRRVLDRLRTEEVARRKEPLLIDRRRPQRERGTITMADPGSLVEDDLLRLVLMCAHPALAPEAASALTLRLVLGVPTPDIARLFLVPEADDGRAHHPRQEADRRRRHPVRRARRRACCPTASTPSRTPPTSRSPPATPPAPAPTCCAPTSRERPIRLGRTVLGLRPDEPVLVALLALMLLQHSRRDARAVDGRLVLLADQDRRPAGTTTTSTRRGGCSPIRRCAGPISAQAAAYTLQARIAAEHALARHPGPDAAGTASSGCTTCCSS